jgi:effector-binding domain-containing protein
VIRPMYPAIIDQLAAADVTPIGPSVAYYTPAPEESEDAIRVQATFPVPVEAVPGLDRIEIPPAEVASLIYHGTMDGIDSAYQILHGWVRNSGFAATGHAREIYLEVPEDAAEWVTEVQLDFTR